jgi:hypothetical protein
MAKLLQKVSEPLRDAPDIFFAHFVPHPHGPCEGGKPVFRINSGGEWFRAT